jgi:hypothetical protein
MISPALSFAGFPLLAELDPHTEGWLWLGVLVVSLVVILILLGMVRRWFMAPMKHTPSDTSDAWKEAGRRLPVPPDEPDENELPEDKPF